ncbi:MAG: HAMP domain-containing histidine kinase, partial [Chloroflexia bacterium]|nr:HAMP domain-containing histidine kinase [Chloroflexia bacterium]
AGGGLRAEQRDLLTNARRNVERLGLLINDLLTHNQLEAGILPLDHEPVDLRTVIADAMAAIQPLVIERGQTLDLDLPVPLPIEGDAVRLEQAVLNVLANATRHTPPGTRIVVVGRVEGDDVLVSVRDDGPGIPPNALEAIFRRFYRITTEEGGSGLGLAIARRIVELHGGRMWAESEPGQGATFWISVPCHRTGGERRP